MGPPPPPPRGALVRGAPVRGAIARGAAVARGVPPLPAVRGAPTPRARAAGIQRIPLPPPPAPEAYEDYVSNYVMHVSEHDRTPSAGKVYLTSLSDTQNIRQIRRTEFDLRISLKPS